ncbi:Clp protease N-terminal domain-containing protein [Streptomyces sp. NPDC002328]|uniref:Clp protease N-terminal domain-containing protein n=1 Tax=Streptomyces sp. NPDC002328 TaxID=3364642 RepID=UPI0036AC46C5
MRPRIPRQPSPDRTAPAQDDDAGCSAELTAAVEGARRRAVRDGDRQIDTAHLLHSLLEHDPEARAAFADGTQLARLLGYLVQRSIGYGLRWQNGVEDSGALPVVTAGEDSDALPVVTAVEGFSPLASAALHHARGRAGGAGKARGVDLLAAIVADPASRAVEVLTRGGVDPLALRARIEDGLDAYAPGGGTAC